MRAVRLWTYQTRTRVSFKRKIFMYQNLLLAELIVEKTQSRKKNMESSENQDSKSWLERFFNFLTPNEHYIATK